MLYDVPQTDDRGEAAMAALIARIRGTAPKPEIFTHGQLTTSQVEDRLALMAAQWIGRIGSALGNRATLPLLRWDAGMDGVCGALVSWSWLNFRGRARDEGSDAVIDAAGEDALAYLARLRRSETDGHTENPQYVDSNGNSPIDAPIIHSSPRSDSHVRSNYGRHRCCR